MQVLSYAKVNWSLRVVRKRDDGYHDLATLMVAVADKGNVRREATFELTGLSGVRQKVGTTCKWAPETAKISSEKR